MSRSSSYVALACVLLIWWPAELVAGPAPNATPEEMRRGREIHERLATLQREDATIARSLDRVGRRLVSATSDAVRASLHAEIASLNARREVIADERTVLETELAALPPDARAAPRPQPPGARTPLDPTGLQPVDVLGGTGQAADARAFNPGIAVIPDIVYFRDDRRGESLAFVEQADGFHGVHADDDHGHAHGALDEGFNLQTAGGAASRGPRAHRPLSDEFLAMMLGSTRPTVTMVASALQKAGLIKYVHGRTQALDAPVQWGSTRSTASSSCSGLNGFFTSPAAFNAAA